MTDEQLSNRELLKTINEINKQFVEHALEDMANFKTIHDHIESVATKQDIKELSDKIDPVIDAYKAVLFSKTFIGGLATVVLSISAIGAGLYWLINSVVHK